MAQKVVLHVGSMKSGTSHIQSLLFANRDKLAEQGVVVPGRSWRDQVEGVSQVLGRTHVLRTPAADAWARLVRDATSGEGTAVISMEFLGPAGPGRIAEVVDSFGATPVQVVVTGRDLGRTVPAMWQEAVRNGDTRTFADFVEDVRTHQGRGKNFWRQHGLASMCKRWADRVGIDNVSLVTVPGPEASPDELWRRFAHAAGIDHAVVQVPERTSEALGAASVEVVRRLNEQLGDLDFARYAPLVKHRLTKEVLAARRAVEPAVGFQVPEWLPPLSERMQHKIEALGLRVVGSLDDLAPRAVPGIDPSGVNPEETVDASVAGLAALVRITEEIRRRQRP